MKTSSNKSRISTLKHLHSIIKVSKLKSLAEIAKFNKSFLKKFNNALTMKDILSFLETKFKFDNIFFNGYAETKNKNSLWIYITEENEISSFSYESLNFSLIKKIDVENDIFIAIGEEAIKFASKHSLNVIAKFINNKEINLAKSLTSFIFSSYISKNVTQVHFVLNSNKIFDKQITILPMKNLKLHFEKYDFKKIEDINTYKFYPSINAFSKNAVHMYLNSIVLALITESYFYKIKQKYIKQNDLLKNIEDKIEFLTKLDINNKRKELTEEILLISQTRK